MSKTPAAATTDERWVADVSDQLAAGLRRRVEALRAAGHDPSTLGAPDELVGRMLAVVPNRSPWSGLGPFYSTKAVAQLLGSVTRQAVEDRRRRHRIVGLRTADGGWVYPAFQFGDDNQVLAGLPTVLATLAASDLSEWTTASMLIAAQSDLGGRSIIDHLRDGRPLDAVLALCRAAVAAR